MKSAGLFYAYRDLAYDTPLLIFYDFNMNYTLSSIKYLGLRFTSV